MTQQYFPRRKGIPLVPNHNAVHDVAVTSLVRSAIAHMVGHAELAYPVDTVRKMFPGDAESAWLTRAAMTPATTSSMPSLSQTMLVDFLTMLGPMSAGSALLARGLRFDFEQSAALKVPSVIATASDVDFVAQGAPIKVRQLLVGGITLEPRKFATIATFTGELFEHSIPNIETIVRAVLTESVALSLDAALLGSGAGDATRPPGLRNGVVALTPSAATPAVEAMLDDISALVEAIAPIAVNAPIVFVAAPARALRMKMRALQMPIEILASGALADDELLAVASNALASACDPVPRLDASNAALLHHEDSSPLQISSGSQGSGVLATPTRSLWQSDVRGVRLIMEVSWGVRHPSGVQWINNISGW